MYSITCRDINSTEIGDLLYSDKSDLDETKVINPSLTLEVNSAGSLQITVPVCNQCYSKIKHITSELVVWRNDTSSKLKEIWSGRVLSEDKDFYNNRVIVCEGEFAYLNDTIQPPMVYENSTIATFLEAVLTEHNRHVEDKMKFYMGTVTVTSESDPVYRSTNYESTMDVLQSSLLENYGGIFRVRHGNDGKRYLDYLSESTAMADQEIRFGLNILDISKHFDLSDFATAVIPLGTLPEETTYKYIFNNNGDAYSDPAFKHHKLTSEVADVFMSKIPAVMSDSEFAVPLYFKLNTDNTGSVFVAQKGTNNAAVLSTITSKPDSYPSLDEYLTVQEVNQGRIDLVSATAVSEYGYICKIVNFDDIETAENLKLAGQLYLTSFQYDNMEIEVSAFDLHYEDPSIDSINILDGVHVVSLYHELDKIFYVTQIDIPFGNPANAMIRLNGSVTGKTVKLSTITKGNTKATQSILGAKAYKPNK